MLLGIQKVPIRSEYTSQISSENALIWYIKHLSWTREPKNLSTFRFANHEVARPKIVSFAWHLAIDKLAERACPDPQTRILFGRHYLSTLLTMGITGPSY